MTLVFSPLLNIGITLAILRDSGKYDWLIESLTNLVKMGTTSGEIVLTTFAG